MRLSCRCGRNLLDVRDDSRPSPVGGHRNPSWTPDGLTVLARPGVRLRSYRPPPPASEGMGAPRTYTVSCECGETWQLNHTRQVTTLWAGHAHRAEKVVRVTLG